jgi:hypothetical protein
MSEGDCSASRSPSVGAASALASPIWRAGSDDACRAEIGATKRGKGLKIMAIVDRHELPLSVSAHAANHHEVRLVQLCFDFLQDRSQARKSDR